MRIVGIDIAVRDNGTGFCEGYFEEGVLHVEQIHIGTDDEDILKRMRFADWCGIDAPFGWPDAFLEAVTEFAETDRWPIQPVEHLPGKQRLHRRLRLRATDLAVQAHTQAFPSRTANPLSVSTELIAGCAMRTAYLLTELANVTAWTFDRTGIAPNDRRVLEVYPGASLACWGIDRTGYKGTTAEHRLARKRIVDELLLHLSERVSFTGTAEPAQLLANDHALDAFVCFLTAAAASRPGGSILPPRDLDTEKVRREGWIHLPTAPL